MHFCRHSGRRSLECCRSLLRVPIPSRMNWFDPVFMNLRVLLLMLLSIEAVLPERTYCGVHLMFTLTIGTLEQVWAQFVLFGFKAWWISFFNGLATPAKFAMVLWFVGSIALDILWILDSTWKSWVTPSPAVFTLCDSRVCISSPNCCNVPSDIEAPIDKTFGLYTTLSIPDVNPDDHHVWFGRHFDYSWFGCESNIVKDLVLFDN